MANSDDDDGQFAKALAEVAKRVSCWQWSKIWDLANKNSLTDEDLAQDEPPDFPGKPLTGGGKAGERQNSFVGPGNSNGRAAEKNPGTFSESATNPAGTSSRGFQGASTSNTRAAERNRLEVLSMDSRRRAAFQASYDGHFPDVKIAQDDNYGKQPAPRGLSHRAAKSASISDYEAQFGASVKKL